MRVECEIKECNIYTDGTRTVPGVCATCSRCGHESEPAYGTGEKSVKRSLMSLRDECPNEEDNFYVAEEGGAESRMPTPIVKPWWQR